MCKQTDSRKVIQSNGVLTSPAVTRSLIEVEILLDAGCLMLCLHDASCSPLPWEVSSPGIWQSGAHTSLPEVA